MNLILFGHRQKQLLDEFFSFYFKPYFYFFLCWLPSGELITHLLSSRLYSDDAGLWCSCVSSRTGSSEDIKLKKKNNKTHQPLNVETKSRIKIDDDNNQKGKYIEGADIEESGPYIRHHWDGYTLYMYCIHNQLFSYILVYRSWSFDIKRVSLLWLSFLFSFIFSFLMHIIRWLPYWFVFLRRSVVATM